MMPRCQNEAIDIELYGTENMLLNKKYKDKYYLDGSKTYKCIRNDSTGGIKYDQTPVNDA